MIRDALTSTWLPMGLCFVSAAIPVPPIQVALVIPAMVLVVFGLARVNGEWLDMQEAIALQDLWRQQRDRWK